MGLKVLIVDDHYLLIEGYKSAFREILPSGSNIEEVHDCESAYGLIVEGKAKSFDLVFLDISLPSFREKNIIDGADLAKLIRTYWPSTKIFVVTSHPEYILLYDLDKSIKPEALVVKSDFTANDLKESLNSVLRGERYISSTVKQAIAKINKRDIYLDNYNRQIISFLAKGIQTKNMHKYLSLSISAIDKRKAQIKDYFLIDKGSDEDILREARRAGLI